MKQEEVRARNKSALFATLTDLGLDQVVVAFNGYSDDGHIQDIEATIAGSTVDLPSAATAFICSDGTESSFSVRDALAAMVYDFLDETDCSWRDGNGAFGEFTFNVEKRTIRLDFNERIVDAEYSSHEF